MKIEDNRERIYRYADITNCLLKNVQDFPDKYS